MIRREKRRRIRDTVFDSIDLSLGKSFGTMTDPEKTAIQDALIGFTSKPAPSAENAALPLTYTVIAPRFEVMTVWFSAAYVDYLIRASESTNGITFNYDSFRSQTIVLESATVNYCFPAGLPDLNMTVMGANCMRGTRCLTSTPCAMPSNPSAFESDRGPTRRTGGTCAANWRFIRPEGTRSCLRRIRTWCWPHSPTRCRTERSN